MEINLYKFKLAIANALITTTDLAEKANVSRTLISNILNGKKSEVQPATVGKLARALDIKVEDLI
ncbi:helix-turn-helix domain-containing protein [Cellulosilyticum sp. WCF-2]|uniref:helix-turn-helix domain-containing protein n=1 Tax=Cellulosilyticum sp. WCF-2 TaxID=2497860 RepID=UPI001A9B51B0|nr:helix-turn-helix transcriptional regulator [Cellulosilyticum sp. WCF-2]